MFNSEYLDSYTICANAEDCHHENLSNVTELPSLMLNDFGVSYNTINTFNPFLISMPVTFEPFQFLDTSIQNFTCERTKLAKEIQNKINQHKKYNNTNAGGKSEALDITMHGVYDIILVFWWCWRWWQTFFLLWCRSESCILYWNSRITTM